MCRSLTALLRWSALNWHLSSSGHVYHWDFDPPNSNEPLRFGVECLIKYIFVSSEDSFNFESLYLRHLVFMKKLSPFKFADTRAFGVWVIRHMFYFRCYYWRSFSVCRHHLYHTPRQCHQVKAFFFCSLLPFFFSLELKVSWAVLNVKLNSRLLVESFGW